VALNIEVGQKLVPMWQLSLWQTAVAGGLLAHYAHGGTALRSAHRGG